MTPEILFFFSKDPAALFLYEAFEARVLAEIDNVAVKVQKTQITYTNPRGFAAVPSSPSGRRHGVEAVYG